MKLICFSYPIEHLFDLIVSSDSHDEKPIPYVIKNLI